MSNTNKNNSFVVYRILNTKTGNYSKLYTSLRGVKRAWQKLSEQEQVMDNEEDYLVEKCAIMLMYGMLPYDLQFEEE